MKHLLIKNFYFFSFIHLLFFQSFEIKASNRQLSPIEKIQIQVELYTEYEILEQTVREKNETFDEDFRKIISQLHDARDPKVRLILGEETYCLIIELEEYLSQISTYLEEVNDIKIFNSEELEQRVKSLRKLIRKIKTYKKNNHALILMIQTFYHNSFPYFKQLIPQIREHHRTFIDTLIKEYERQYQEGVRPLNRGNLKLLTEYKQAMDKNRVNLKK